jgi:hypothetical protein
MFWFTSETPDFWIQLKGENAGRPILAPCVNSVGVKADRQIFNPKYLYYMFVHVHNTGIYRTMLKGSVIPYIRQGDILAAFLKCFQVKAGVR